MLCRCLVCCLFSVTVIATLWTQYRHCIWVVVTVQYTSKACVWYSLCPLHPVQFGQTSLPCGPLLVSSLVHVFMDGTFNAAGSVTTRCSSFYDWRLLEGFPTRSEPLSQCMKNHIPFRNRYKTYYEDVVPLTASSRPTGHNQSTVHMQQQRSEVWYHSLHWSKVKWSFSLPCYSNIDHQDQCRFDEAFYPDLFRSCSL